MPKEIYFNQLKYKNDMDLLRKIIRIYSIVKLNDDLENHEEEVLMFYFKYGYSSETKNKIRDALGITAHYLNTINYHLDKKGYLRKDEYNKQKKHLTKDLQQLREAFLEKEIDIYAIGIKRDDKKK